MTLIAEDISDPSIVPYTKLAIAVIKQAIEDATMEDLPDPDPTLKRLGDALGLRVEEAKAREDARTFLTTMNPVLEYWCQVAGLSPRTVLHYSKGAATDWVGLGKRFRLHQVRKTRTTTTTISGQESDEWPPLDESL